MLWLCQEHKSYFIFVIFALECPLYMVNVEQVFTPSDQKLYDVCLFLLLRCDFDNIFSYQSIVVVSNECMWLSKC
jgi:hypothetical protein